MKKIRLVPIGAAQLPRSLDDTDCSVVNGNFALASGLKLNSALALEKTGRTYQNVVALRTEDKDKPSVQDFADAYRSRDFLAGRAYTRRVDRRHQQPLMARTVDGMLYGTLRPNRRTTMAGS